MTEIIFWTIETIIMCKNRSRPRIKRPITILTSLNFLVHDKHKKITTQIFSFTLFDDIQLRLLLVSITD